jgi:glutamate racemase
MIGRQKSHHLGLLDWGIGGISVLKKLLVSQPDLQITYFSDSGSVPYGQQSETELRARLEKIFHFLKENGAVTIVVACNAASTVVIEEESFEGLPLINVIKPLMNHVDEIKSKKLGVIGGQRTIDSHIYKEQIESQSSIKVFEQVAQPLSALIEAGKTQLKAIVKDLEPIMGPLQSQGIDSLVLACTHYPALVPVLKKLYPNLKLIDPADFVVKELKENLQASETPGISYFTTGDVDLMRDAATKAFNWPTKNIKKHIIE